MKRYSVAVNDELYEAISAFAERHLWSVDRATAELLWRQMRREVSQEARRVAKLKRTDSTGNKKPQTDSN